MIDCSHGNSCRDHAKQSVVANSLADQIADGSDEILGVMIESHLVEGRQNYNPGGELTYGMSITDGCISLEQTKPVLARLAEAVASRRRVAA
jgi:3-deoxy-7-phosphoheptulonate synthase